MESLVEKIKEKFTEPGKVSQKTKNWLEEMTKIELAVCDLKPYKDISFLQHLWLKK